MSNNLIDIGQLSYMNIVQNPPEQQRDMMSRLHQRPVFNIIKTPLNECLDYFRKLGLTDEQIRKAITPALFKALV